MAVNSFYAIHSNEIYSKCFAMNTTSWNRTRL